MPATASDAAWVRGLVALVAGAIVAAAALLELFTKQWLISAGVVALGFVGAVAGVVLYVVQHSRKEQEDAESLLHGAPQRVRERVPGAGMYKLGVENEAPGVLDHALSDTSPHAPYAWRNADEAVAQRLKDAAGEPRASMIVLGGPSKAGKTRTALEVLARVLPDGWVLVPADRERLATLASRPAPSDCRDGVIVIWLDDIEPWIVPESADAAGNAACGLNHAVLQKLDLWERPVVVYATAFGKGARQTEGDYADIVGSFIDAHAPILLEPWLNDEEQARLEASEDFTPEGAERIAEEGIGPYMILARTLRARLDSTESPAGVALTRAAIDARRCGLLDPLDRQALESLATNYPGHAVSQTERDAALAWAHTPIYGDVAMLSGAERYAPYDYLVRSQEERHREIPPGVWRAVVEEYTTNDSDVVEVGYAAWTAGQSELAERAWSRGAEHGNGLAAYNLGVLLEERGDLEEAEAAYRRADQRGVAAGAHNRGVLLQERGDLEEAEAAYRRADQRGDAAGANNLGVLLKERGDLEEAEDAYSRADERGVAAGAHNLGVLLQERGDLEEAEAAYRRADQHGDAAGANNLGVLLYERGDLEEAEAAWRRADQRGHPDAATNLGLLTEERRQGSS
jgi:Flp pilus assembly protein TadD